MVLKTGRMSLEDAVNVFRTYLGIDGAEQMAEFREAKAVLLPAMKAYATFILEQGYEKTGENPEIRRLRDAYMDLCIKASEKKKIEKVDLNKVAENLRALDLVDPDLEKKLARIERATELRTQLYRILHTTPEKGPILKALGALFAQIKVSSAIEQERRLAILGTETDVKVIHPDDPPEIRKLKEQVRSTSHTEGKKTKIKYLEEYELQRKLRMLVKANEVRPRRETEPTRRPKDRKATVTHIPTKPAEKPKRKRVA